MGVLTIPLNCISPNPFQTRNSEDPEHIKNLALSIAAQGLLQIPSGRLADKDGRGTSYHDAVDKAVADKKLFAPPTVIDLLGSGYTLQLAFGHSRLAAFKWLADVQSNSNIPGDWSAMPVNLVDLSDEQMFQAAVAENLERRQLTPIEEARAMLRYREDFGKTSAEIGDLFHLSDSAVRNKIRLLQLPEVVQQGFCDHRISESAGRALLELFDLPEELRQMAENTYWFEGKPSQIVKAALSGVTAEQLQDRITGIIHRFGHDLIGASWKLTDDFSEAEDPRIVGACKGCAFLAKHDKQNLCLKQLCFEVKTGQMKRRYLEKASEITGIAVNEGDSNASTTDFGRVGVEAIITAKSIHCPNLRLVYDEYGYRPDENDHLKSIGYPKAKIVCGKQQQWCSCIQAIKAGLKERLLEKAAPVVEQPAGELVDGSTAEPGPAPAPITAEELKDLNREVRQQKKQNLAEIEAINQDAAKVVAAGLMDINTNPRLLKEILRAVGGGVVYDLEKRAGDFSDNPQAWCEEIRLMIGKHLVFKYGSENYYYQEPDPALSLKRLNEFLKRAGLEELASVSAETEVEK